MHIKSTGIKIAGDIFVLDEYTDAFAIRAAHYIVWRHFKPTHTKREKAKERIRCRQAIIEHVRKRTKEGR